jgi:hypothetical protein
MTLQILAVQAADYIYRRSVPELKGRGKGAWDGMSG